MDLNLLLELHHENSVKALLSFMEFCLSRGYFDEAKERMQKSLADHQEMLGEQHVQTLQSMTRLGNFYRLREEFGSNEVLLVRAKIGLERLYTGDPEELFSHTVEIDESLIAIYKIQGVVKKQSTNIFRCFGKLSPWAAIRQVVKPSFYNGDIVWLISIANFPLVVRLVGPHVSIPKLRAGSSNRSMPWNNTRR